MTAQIRRKNDRSKLVEQEFGRRLYATDLPYEEAMDQLSQKYLDSVKLIKQSEFEKPYLEDDYSAMEYAFLPPGAPEFPSGPGSGVSPDCVPKGYAIGGGQPELLCDSSKGCGKWCWSCAHKIVSFSAAQDHCWIQNVIYSEPDTVCVVFCCDDKGRENIRGTGIIAHTYITGQDKKDYVSKIDFNFDCCAEKTLTMGYSTQQMTCGGSPQTLTALPGTDPDDCYIWSLTGGGSLSKNSGKSVVYTPPATNVNCANNPTIYLSNKALSTGVSLKIAVNCAGPGGPAYKILVDTATLQCSSIIVQRTYNCEGTFGEEIGCDSCDYSGSCPPCCADCCNWDPGLEQCVPIGGFCCTQAALIARCSGCATCALGVHDIRSDEQKAAGCCPATLL